jgi:hypothetical protein
MSANRNDTTTDESEIPAQGKYTGPRDPVTRDYPMYFDGAWIGSARTPAEAEETLNRIAYECLYHRTHWPAASESEPVASEPLPPVCAVAEALDDLERSAPDPTIYAQARDQLVAEVPVTFDGAAYQIGGSVIALAPVGERWPWPWVCACGAARCWHAALCDAIRLAADRLAEVRADQAALQHHPPYAALLLVCGVCVLILWAVPLPTAEQNAAGLGLLHGAVRAVIVGR